MAQIFLFLAFCGFPPSSVMCYSLCFRFVLQWALLGGAIVDVWGCLFDTPSLCFRAAVGASQSAKKTRPTQPNGQPNMHGLASHPTTVRKREHFKKSQAVKIFRLRRGAPAPTVATMPNLYCLMRPAQCFPAAVTLSKMMKHVHISYTPRNPSF